MLVARRLARALRAPRRDRRRRMARAPVVQARRADRAGARAPAQRASRRCASWGLSATLANLDEALECLVGVGSTTRGAHRPRRSTPRRSSSTACCPTTIERFPWAGHLGLEMLPDVVRAIDRARSTLVFTNVRSPTEIWYQAILEARPDWAGTIALHHGSLERDVRDWVEDGLRDGRLRAVVCTSSLDLGVDFAPVDQVLQIGSPKGVARLLQRAGRSGHRPGADLARHGRADAGARARRGRGRARGRRRARDRAARAARRAARRARPAPRHLRARRRLRARRAARRSARARTRYAALDRRANGSGRSTSSCTAARASTRIPSTGAS